MQPDSVVVGGGIIGCAIARALAKEGRRVVVVERGEIGRESSWAAAGLLTPIHLAEYPAPLAQLCIDGAALWGPFVDELKRESSIDLEYRDNGVVMLATTDEDRETIAQVAAWKRERGHPVEAVEHPKELEPVLAPELAGGLYLPGVAQLRNNRVAPALAEAATKLGVEFRPNCEVLGFLRVPGRITGVKTSRGDLLAKETIMAAGAWAADLLSPIGVEIDVHPVRGQIALLEGPPNLVQRVILWGDRYIVPRSDGRILLGSTVEDVGFDKRVTVEGIAGILTAAVRIAPGLARLPVVQTWAGLRPGTSDRLPYIGRAMEGLVLATGHYRNGILLAPITARIIADLLAGRPCDLEAFAPRDQR